MRRIKANNPSFALTDEDRAWLIRMREEHGMTKKAVAEAIGYTQLHYGRVENGYALNVRKNFFDALNALYGSSYAPKSMIPSKPGVAMTSAYVKTRMPVTKELCDWMYESRTRLGMTQKEMSKWLGCSVATYNAIEYGTAKTASKQLVKGMLAIFDN